MFDVVRAFKGPEVPQIAVVHDNSSCDLPFATGRSGSCPGMKPSEALPQTRVRGVG